jgi:hypothetical protein
MPVYALITWIVTALGGLYLLAIWLIEYDPDFQRAAATRLPVPVVSSHALLAVGGLVIWIMYLVTEEAVFEWATIAILAFVATFGLTMAVRWIGVYRAGPVAPPAAAMTGPATGNRGPRGAWTPGGQRTRTDRCSAGTLFPDLRRDRPRSVRVRNHRSGAAHDSRCRRELTLASA